MVCFHCQEETEEELCLQCAEKERRLADDLAFSDRQRALEEEHYSTGFSYLSVEETINLNGLVIHEERTD